MKVHSLFFLLIALVVTVEWVDAQSLPIDFEASIVTADFTDFEGGTASVIDNPQSSGINTSATVAQIVRDGGEIWAGSKIELSGNLDFSSLNTISMKVYSTAPVGTIVKFKLEGAEPGISTERDVPTTVSNEWEVMTWDFSGVATQFNFLVFMFDFGNIGDGSAASTFLFDDVEQLFGGNWIDLPVDFEDDEVNYTMTDFGGNSSSLTNDPTDATNHVMQAIKTAEAEEWAGTTIGPDAGFASNIPLTLSDSKMTVKVWSPEAGTPIRLKVEDANDLTHTCETQINTTVAEAWEVLVFDFTNEVDGTASLSDGLAGGWIYNKASIFFNFGTSGEAAGEKTYYFDNVGFGDWAVGLAMAEIEDLKIAPNPADDFWTISTGNENITLINIFDLKGQLLLSLQPNHSMVKMDASNFSKGFYMAHISTSSGSSVVKLLKN